MPEKIKIQLPDEIAWINDESMTAAEHVNQVQSTDLNALSPESHSRFRTHAANIRQKEMRINSARSIRMAIKVIDVIKNNPDTE